MKASLKQIRIAIMVAIESEDLEVVVPYDLWKRAHIHVETISVEKKNSIVLSHGTIIKCNDIIDKTNLSQYNAIYLPGGPGFIKFMLNEKLRDALIKFSKDTKKWLLALCAAPSIFFKLDLLEKEKATCYPSVAVKEKCSALPNYVKKKVVTSGHFITGAGPGVAFDFALQVIAELLGKKDAQAVADQILLTKKII